MKRRWFPLLLAFLLSSIPGLAGSDYDSRIARLSYLEGHVSFQHAKDVDWSAASINTPLQPADRIYTGEDGRAEIQFDEGSVLRLAEKTDVEILSLSEDLIQLRILVGLTTLTVESSAGFEINTPAAAFNTIRKGVYRFDVLENGDADAIVRKGLLDAANNNLSRRVESGEVLHVTAGEQSTHTVARYDSRDQWDEWNDRRNADLTAYESRKYLPDHVSAGVSELDRYGRWVDVDEYGPAWVPLNVDAGWSPYWVGRWVYRPFWGWTWVSYEPWGWVPYHYGRWHFRSNLGWCWLPGPSLGFHFWSPGLVRFYQGPGWVSWCPLGPGDYYNVNHYAFQNTYRYQLNELRLLQRRGPEDLANRHVSGAFRTTRVDQFAGESLGDNRRALSLGEAPWVRGRLVTDQPAVQPTSRSYRPLPDRQVAPPTAVTDRPVLVRTQPAADAGFRTRFSRITNPSVGALPVTRARERGGEDEARGSGVNPGYSSGSGSRPNTGSGGPVDSTSRGSPGSTPTGGRSSGADQNSRRGSAGGAGPQETPRPGRYERSNPAPRPRTEPGSRSDSPSSRPTDRPSSPGQRYDRTPPPLRSPGPDRPNVEPRPKPAERTPKGAYYSPRPSDPSPRSWEGNQGGRWNARGASSSFATGWAGTPPRSARTGSFGTPVTARGAGSSGPAVQNMPQSRSSTSSSPARRRDR